jgi:hypothetical protein
MSFPLKPVPSSWGPVVKQARPTSSTVTGRLRPVYAEDWRYPLRGDAETSTQPTRACTEVFYSGAQGRHEEAPMNVQDGGGGRQTEGGGY